jgi:cytidine deaminase
MNTVPQGLLEAARAASRAAHAPYSGFPVGAALETVDGARFVGCNVENASYGLTVCAERVAIFSAVAAREVPRTRPGGEEPTGRSAGRFIRALALSCPRGDPSEPNSLMPCGACRQVMAEFLTEEAWIEVDGVGRFTLPELLPHGFTLPREDARPPRASDP